ncbi:LuxR C-terminal-related transcriptional regulator [Microbacterium tumbae]
MSSVHAGAAPRDRPELDRPRLVARIEQSHTACIVRAPHGFGKSVVLRQWADRTSAHVIWIVPVRAAASATAWLVSPAPMDDDGHRSIAIGDRTASALEALALAEAEITGDADTAVVVDGLHLMRDRAAHERIADLIRRHPRVRLIAATRSRTVVPSLLPDADTVTADDLALTADEVTSLAELHGAGLGHDDAEALADAFGGWPAMIDKVVRHLARRPATSTRVHDAIVGADASFGSWLMDDVVDPRLVDTMVRLAIAETLTVGSARFLTGDERIDEALDELAEQGLIGRTIGPDGEEPAYEFPGVIRRVVLSGVARAPEWDGDERSAALASWWKDQGRPEIALRQAYARKDWPFIAELFESSWHQLVNLSEDVIVTAMRQMPADVAARYPKTHAVRHLILGAAMSPEDLPPPAVSSFLDIVDLARRTNPVQAAERAVADFIVLRRSGRYEDAVRVGRVAHYLSIIVGAGIPEYMRPFVPMARLQLALTYELAGRGKDAAEQLALALAALERAPEVNGFERNQITGVLAVKAAIEGDLRSAGVWLSRQVDVRGTLPRMWLMPHVPSAAQIARAITALDRLDRNTADSELGVLRLLETRDELWAMAAWAQARYDLLWSDRPGGFQHLDVSRMRHQEWFNPESAADALLLAAEVDLLLAAGEGTRAAAVLTRTNSVHPMIQLARARLDWLTGDIAGALSVTREILRTRHVTDRVRLETLILRATLLERAGNPNKSRSRWIEACTMAQRMGDPLLPFALTHAGSRDAPARDIPELAQVLERLRRARIPEIFPGSLEIIRLTERELAVLEKLADDVSVAAIARLHFVSEATVKSQMRSLYAKLGAHSRIEAVNAAQSAGIIWRE